MQAIRTVSVCRACGKSSGRGVHAWWRRVALVLVLAAVTAGCGGGGGGVGSTSGIPTASGTGSVVVHLDYAAPGAGKRVANAVAPAIPAEASSFLVRIVDAQGIDVVPAVSVVRQTGVDQQTVMVDGVPLGTFNVLVMMLDSSGQSLGMASPQAVVVDSSTLELVVSSGATLVKLDFAVHPAAFTEGTTMALEVNATFTDGTTIPITSLATWTSESPAIATVAPGGIATAVSYGVVNITASWRGQSVTTMIMVGMTPPPAGGPVWGAVSNLSTTDAGVDKLRLKMSADGTRASAIWIYNDGAQTSIQTASARINRDAATWGPVTTLSAPGQSSVGPDLALSPDGTRAIAVWQRSNGTVAVAQAACAAISGSTATWGTVQDVSDLAGNAFLPQVAMSTDGSMAITGWHREVGGMRVATVRAATISNRIATWGSATDLSTDTASCNNLRLAMSADGTKVTAMWCLAQGGSILETASGTVPASDNAMTWGAVTDLPRSGVIGDQYSFALSASGTRATVIFACADQANQQSAMIAWATIDGTIQSWGNLTTASGTAIEILSPRVALTADCTRAMYVWSTHMTYLNITRPETLCATINGATISWSANDIWRWFGTATDADVALSADGSRAVGIFVNRDQAPAKLQCIWATIRHGVPCWSDAVDVRAPQGVDHVAPVLGMSADGTLATAAWRRLGSGGASATVQSASFIWP